MTYLSIGYIDGNSCYDSASVMAESDFTEEELDLLYDGYEIEKDGEILYLCE